MKDLWKSIAAIALQEKLTKVGASLMPGSPMMGAVAGMAASEMLGAKVKELRVNPGDAEKVQAALREAQQGLAHGDPRMGPVVDSVKQGLREVDAEIDNANGFHEFALPKNFTIREIRDRESGLLEPPSPTEFQVFLNALGDLRKAYGRPMRVSSCWRSLSHSAEANKPPDALHRHYHRRDRHYAVHGTSGVPTCMTEGSGARDGQGSGSSSTAREQDDSSTWFGSSSTRPFGATSTRHGVMPGEARLGRAGQARLGMGFKQWGSAWRVVCFIWPHAGCKFPARAGSVG